MNVDGRRRDAHAAGVRRWVAYAAVLAFGLAGLLSAGHVGHDGHDGRDHGHDDGNCGICTLLAQSTLPAPLPEPLPAHEPVADAPAVEAPIAPAAAFLGFALARGPPSSPLA